MKNCHNEQNSLFPFLNKLHISLNFLSFWKLLIQAIKHSKTFNIIISILDEVEKKQRFHEFYSLKQKKEHDEVIKSTHAYHDDHNIIIFGNFCSV